MTLGCALSACGGGGGGSPADPPASPPSSTSPASSAAVVAPASTAAAPKLTVTSITFEGDSTAFGIGATLTTNEPADLQGLLNIPVTDAGVSGSTTAENLDGTAPYFTTQLATRLAIDPSQIVVMNYGINDSHTVTLDVYEQNLFDWVRTVRSFGKIPVFEEPNPSSIAGYATALPPFVEAMDRAAAQLNVPLVSQYNYIMSLPNWQSLLADGLHPSAALYAIKAARTAAVIKTLL